MKITTFTDTMIKKLKPEGSDYSRSEGNGFTITVRTAGTKTWLYLYTIDGARRKMNLGSYPAVTLETARGKFQEAQVKVKNGVDPLAEVAMKKMERQRTPTVAKFIEEYLLHHAGEHKRLRSQLEDKRILEKEIVPLWGNMKITDIKRRDLTPILDAIKIRPAPVMANRVLACVRKVFSFAVDRDAIESNPFLGMKTPNKEKPRDRVLTTDEIRILWGNLESAKMGDEVRRALKLVLLTGQRPGEVTGMHSSEIDGQWWTIPKERAKNGLEHRVFLTDTVLELVGERTGFIMESPLIPGQPIGERPLCRALLRSRTVPITDDKGKPLFNAEGKPAVKNLLGVADFTPHDLRRTCATMLSELKHSDEIIDMILNHKKSGIRGTYNKNRYDVEKQGALESWERKLLSIVTGASSCNVVSITAGKKKAA
jgi:integrase